MKEPWTYQEVEQLAKLMREAGLNVVEIHGLKMVRHPQQHFYDGLAERAASLQQNAARQITDDELLDNPYAGLSLEGSANV